MKKLLLLIALYVILSSCNKNADQPTIKNDTTYCMVGYQAISTFSELPIFSNHGYKYTGIMPTKDSIVSFIQLNDHKIKQINIISVSKFESAKDFYNFYK